MELDTDSRHQMLQFHNYSDHFEHCVTTDYLKHVLIYSHQTWQ